MNSVPMLGISLVIARNKEGKFLAVKENYNKKWWLPGSFVDPPVDFIIAGIRETKEEAGIDVVIKGVLRIEKKMKTNLRYKVIDQNQKPKSIPDSESEEARWVSLQELKILSESLPHLRGLELVNFGKYLEGGGQIYPLEIISHIFVNKKKMILITRNHHNDLKQSKENI